MQWRRMGWGRALLVGGLLSATGPHVAVPVRSAASRPLPPVYAAQATAGGVHLSVQVPRMRYFLSQLLPVRIALRNTAGHALTLAGGATQDDDPALWAGLSGGSAPYYEMPFAPLVGGRPLTSTLLSGQTLVNTVLLPLTASGEVTLKAWAQFPMRPYRWPDGAYSGIPTDPFKGRGPTLRLVVALRIPANRRLHLQVNRSGTGTDTVTAHALDGAHPSLLYQAQATCHGVGVSGPYTEVTGTRYWTPLPSGGVGVPACSGTLQFWDLMASAAGYAIASARYK